jgi:hypothetical protein
MRVHARMIVEILAIDHGGVIDLVNCALNLPGRRIEMAHHIRLQVRVANNELRGTEIAARVQIARVALRRSLRG